MILLLSLLMSLGLQTQSVAHERWWILLPQDQEGNANFAESTQMRRSGDTVLLWTHRFFLTPQDGAKSAMIQYEVNCGTYSLRERRYIDFREGRDILSSGDNSETSSLTEVAPGTVGSHIVRFACASEQERPTFYRELASTMDIFELGEFFARPGQLVAEPVTPNR